MEEVVEKIDAEEEVVEKEAVCLWHLGAFLNKGATPAWARVCGRSPAVPSLKVAPQKCTSSKW